MTDPAAMSPRRSGHSRPDRGELRERAIAALTTDELSSIVDLVTWVETVDGEVVAHAANHHGRVRLRPGGRHEVLAGRDPIPSEDPMAFLPYAEEVANPSPLDSRDNAYPYAAERILSLFGDPDRSPDLAIVHTPRHFFPDEGGHHGEHGSLDVIQSRAPLILSGAGVARRGYVDDHARLVDVGPTMALLAGAPSDDIVTADGAALDTDGEGVPVPTDGGAALVVAGCGAAASEDHDLSLIHI